MRERVTRTVAAASLLASLASLACAAPPDPARTVTVIAHGPGASTPLPSASRPLGNVSLADTAGRPLSLQDWQERTCTDALLVLHHGRVVLEHYRPGVTPQQPQALGTLGEALVGLLARQWILEGRLDAAAPVALYLPELQASPWADATVQQTLDMTTSAMAPQGRQAPMPDALAPATACGPAPEPTGPHGERFQPKSWDADVVVRLLERVSGQGLPDLLSERLWGPMGAEDDALLGTDPSAGPGAGLGISATTRDLARLGELLRLGGRLDGRQVLDPRVVAELRRGGDPAHVPGDEQPLRRGQAFHDFWWVLHDPDGSFEAEGMNGQRLYINPAAAMVLVKLTSRRSPATPDMQGLDRNAVAAIARHLRTSGTFR